MHDAAFAWDAGFIRQVCNRRVLLPDKSGVPVVVSRCARPGRAHLKEAGLERLFAFCQDGYNFNAIMAL
jgi:hypothetical protein